MISRVLTFFLAFVASCYGFVAQTGKKLLFPANQLWRSQNVFIGAARSMLKASALSMKLSIPQTIASMVPAAIAAPAFASDVSCSTPTFFSFVQLL